MTNKINHENTTWGEWSIYILKELERLDENIKDISLKLSEVQNKTIDNCPNRKDYVYLKEDIEKINKSISEINKSISSLKLVLAKWSGIGFVVLILINIVIRYFYILFK